MKEFLLEEYRSLTESLHINEEVGEKRLTFFITLVSGVMAGIVTLLTNFDEIPFEFMYAVVFLVIGTLVAILVVGRIIYFRMKKRNRTTDGFKKDLRRIRNIMKLKYADEHETNLKYYGAFGNNEQRRFTSLVHVMAVLNAFVAGFIVFLTIYFSGPATFEMFIVNVIITIVIIALIVFEGLRGWMSPTHGGGVLIKKTGNKPLVLLVTSKKTGDWVFPKGHIDPKPDNRSELETADQTAIREMREEAGYDAEIVAYLGETAPYVFNGKKILVSYYLMFPLSDVPQPAEDRKKEWVEIPEAIKMVKNEDLKRLLTEVAMMV